MPRPKATTAGSIVPSGITVSTSVADRPADAGVGEHQPERRQHQRQHRRPADRVDQPAPLVERRQRRRPQPGEDDREREQHAEAEQDEGLAVALEQAGLVERRVEIEQGADDGGQQHDQDRQEQPVAVALALRRALRLAGRGRAAADQLESRQRGEAEHQQAVGDVAEPVPGEQAERDQAPEGGVAEALRVGAVERAEQRPGREQRPDQIEDVLDA